MGAPAQHHRERQLTQFTWATAVAHATQQLEGLHKKLENVEVGEVETAVIRGEIRALKRLIALPETAARQALMVAQQHVLADEDE